MKMMIKKIFVIYFLLRAICSFSEDAPDLVWEKRYDVTNTDVSTDVVSDSFGNVYVIGYTGTVGTYRCLTLKYNSNGDLLWAKTYDSGIWGSYHIAVDSTGNVYVAGIKSFGDHAECLLFKYNSNGDLVWEKTYSSSAIASGIALDLSGNIYIETYTSRGGGYYDCVTIKYSPNGDIIWEKKYSGEFYSNYGFTGITVDLSGNVYVTGYGGGYEAADNKSTIIKYNSDGGLIWAKTYRDTKYFGTESRFLNNDIKSTTVHGIATDSLGNVYITGISHVQPPASDGIHHTFVYKLDANGDVIWKKLFYPAGTPPSGHEGGLDIVVDISGNSYIIIDNDSQDYFCFKLDTSGNFIWGETYSRWTNRAGNFNKGVAIDTIGNVYVTGYSNKWGTTNNDFLTIKYKQHIAYEGTSEIDVDGGEISPLGESLSKIIVPAGSTDKKAKWTFKWVQTNGLTQGITGSNQVITCYDIDVAESASGTAIKTLKTPATLKLQVMSSTGEIIDSSGNKTGVGLSSARDGNRLAIGYWDGLRWIPITSTIEDSGDGISVVVSAKINHLSRYGVVVKEQAGGIALTVGPNPFTPLSSDNRFNQTVFNVENSNGEEIIVDIWDISGVHTREVKGGGTGISEISWDGKDDNGRVVESGIYLYVIKVGTGIAGRGTIVVAK